MPVEVQTVFQALALGPIVWRTEVGRREGKFDFGRLNPPTNQIFACSNEEESGKDQSGSAPD